MGRRTIRTMSSYIREENRLTSELSKKGISRNELSRLTNTSLPTLRKYLNSPELFPIYKAKKIMKALEVNNEYGFKKLFI